MTDVIQKIDDSVGIKCGGAVVSTPNAYQSLSIPSPVCTAVTVTEDQLEDRLDKGDQKVINDILTNAKDGAFSNALMTVDYAHHEIHAGSHYFIKGYVELDDTDSFCFAVTTPDTTKWSHMFWTITSINILTIDVFESGVITGGASVTPINNNRNSIKTSTLTIVSGPTISDSGTLLHSTKYGADGNKAFGTVGGSDARESELILKQNTTYLWEITSGADSNIVDYNGFWYEHTNK